MNLAAASARILPGDGVGFADLPVLTVRHRCLYLHDRHGNEFRTGPKVSIVGCTHDFDPVKLEPKLVIRH